MNDSERSPSSDDFKKFNTSGFETVPKYKDLQRVPNTVVKQTHATLGLYRRQILPDTNHAEEYLRGYTFPFLDNAVKGAGIIFERNKASKTVPDKEVTEAADLSNVIFSCMPELAKFRYLPNGFSRRGMLHPPDNKEKFIQRIDEIRYQIAFIVSGLREVSTPLKTSTATFRAMTFFKVGNMLPDHFSKNSVQEKAPDALGREYINKLLEGIQINFA